MTTRDEDRAYCGGQRATAQTIVESTRSHPLVVRIYTGFFLLICPLGDKVVDMEEIEGRKVSFKEMERLLTLQEVIEAAERAKIPLRIDRPGFTRIVVDLQESLRRPIATVGRELKLGIANVSY